MAKNFTRREQVQHALRASEKRLALAASGARFGMFEWNVAAGKVHCTEQCAQLLGGRKRSTKTTASATTTTLSQSCTYHDWAKRVHPDDLARVEAELRRCTAAHAPYDVEYRVLWPDKSPHWVASRGVFEYDPRGRPQRMLGILMDITRQKWTEGALRQSEQALADFFTEAPVGLLWVAPDGRILRANYAQAAMLGYRLEELRGREARELCADPEAAREMILRLARMEPVHDNLLRLRRRDHSILQGLIDANGLWRDGKLVHSRWFIRDITRYVELQKEILAIGERVQQRIGQDLHDDLCQRLTSIEFLSRALERQLGLSSPAEAARAKEIARLTRQAITYTRELSHTMSPMELAAEGLVRALKNLANQTKDLFGIDCRFRGDVRWSFEDNTVQTYLYRIAQEAIQNAMKHGKARRIQIGLKENRDHIVLSVQDDGVGLPLKMRKRRGFGLHIMNYRANTLGGSLDVQKGKRRGVCLVCSIPKAFCHDSQTF